MTTSPPFSGKRRRSRLLTSGLILTMTGALAAEPCPWEKPSEDAKLCSEWNALAERLEAAEQRALAAETKLETILGADQPDATAFEPATGPQAARSRRIIRRVLDSLGRSVLDLGKLETDPEMVLTRDGDRYRAIFATAAWRLGSTRVDFGPLELVVELLDDTLARVVVGLGELITVRRGDRLIARLTIGAQETEGIWDEELGGFVQADLSLQRLGLELTGEPVSGEIGTLRLSHTLQRFDDDTWSSQQTLGLNKLMLRDETGDLIFSLSHGSGQLSMDGRHYRRLVDRNEARPETAAAQAGSNAQLLMLTRQVDALLSHLEASLTVTDLAIDRGGEPLGRLARMSMASRFDEELGRGSKFHCTLALDGLQPLQSALPTEFLPIAGQLELGVLEIPPGYLAQMVEIGLAGEQIQDDEAKEAYWRRESIRLLRGAPMRFYVTDSFVATPGARADVTLRAVLDPAAAPGGKGDLTVGIEGLQGIIDSSNAAEQPGLASFLALLTVFSERSEASGRVVDNYHIRITEDGKLWLNGKDLSALLPPSPVRP